MQSESKDSTEKTQQVVTLRMDPDLHKWLREEAYQKRTSMNKLLIAFAQEKRDGEASGGAEGDDG